MRRVPTRALLTVALTGALLAGSGANAQSLVSNGSFESGVAPGSFLFALPPGDTSIDGWTIDSGSVDYIGSLWQASDGARSIDVSGVGGSAGVISQTVPTEVGLEYRVIFDLAGNPAGAPAVKELSVQAEGAAPQVFLFDATGRSLADMGWTTRTYTFVATASSTRLGFTSLTTSGFGPALDNVRVAAVDGTDTDRDGMADATDHCPADPMPWLPVASQSIDPANRGLPRGGNVGPWAVRNIYMLRGVIPTPGPQYKTCASFKTEHLQDVAALDTSPWFDGRMEYAASHSQDLHGHMMVFATFPGEPGQSGQQTPPDEDLVLEAGATAAGGEGVWYRRLDRASAEGPYNHPGDLALVGQTLIVAGQNWDGGEGEAGFCEGELDLDRAGRSFEAWQWYLDGFEVKWRPYSVPVAEPDAILFYDVSVPASPRYLGKIFVASLPVHPGFASNFGWGKLTSLFASRVGDHVYMQVDGRWYRSDRMSWHADDWTPVSAGLVPLASGRASVQVQTSQGQRLYSLNESACIGCTVGFQYSSPGAPTPPPGGAFVFATFEPEYDLFATRSGKTALVSASGGFFISPAGEAVYIQQVSTTNTGPVSWPLGAPPPPPTPTNASPVCAAPAFADVDLGAPGDALITLDHASGLQWLDLTQTVGLSKAQVQAGPWASAGWRLATQHEVCALFEHAGVSFSGDCEYVPAWRLEVPAHDYPARLARLMSRLGLTRQTLAPGEIVDQQPAAAVIPPSFPPWTIIEAGDFSCPGLGTDCDPIWHFIKGQLDQGNAFGAPGWSFGRCGPDAETGWCAVEGFYDSGDGLRQVASLSRGLAKCSQSDVRKCMDGIIAGFAAGSASVCKKCAIVGDSQFCSPAGCPDDRSFPEVGSFLVRPAPVDNCPYFDSLDLTDTDGDGRGDVCECTDQNGDGRNNVADLVAINQAIFNPTLVTPLCDGNNDGRCNVSDILAANAEIYSPGNTSTCARQPFPGP